MNRVMLQLAESGWDGGYDTPSTCLGMHERCCSILRAADGDGEVLPGRIVRRYRGWARLRAWKSIQKPQEIRDRRW